MKWTDQDRLAFTDALENPYKYKVDRSLRSISHEKSCYSPETLMNLVTPQIVEVLDNNLEYETPEGWDRSFAVLGGGQGRRTSSAILKIMNWNQFLNKINEIRLNKCE